MNINDILNSSSPEIQELLYAIEKANTLVSEYIAKQIPSLEGDIFLDNREVCKLLHVSPRTLQEYRDKRLVAFYKLEGKVLYKMSDIQQMLEKNYYDAWKQRR